MNGKVAFDMGVGGAHDRIGLYTVLSSAHDITYLVMRRGCYHFKTNHVYQVGMHTLIHARVEEAIAELEAAEVEVDGDGEVIAVEEDKGTLSSCLALGLCRVPTAVVAYGCCYLVRHRVAVLCAARVVLGDP
jgi:hypothetical protein